MSDPPSDLVRDVESSIGGYEPYPDRRFEAADSGAVFIGDGSRWHIVAADNEPWAGPGREAVGSPGIQLGPRGFPVVNQEYRGRLMSYEAAYTKPVFHWTFDGGTQNIYESAPLFNELGLTPTLAISPTHVGTEECMDWGQLREVVTQYGWAISNHGFEHNRFDETEPPEQEREVVEAIEALRRHGLSHQHYMYSWGMAGGAIGRSIVANVYPFAWGTTDPVEASGIQNVRSAYALPRVFVERSDREAIEGAIDRAVEAQTGMVFIGHNVREDEPVDPDGFETDADLIEHLASYVRDVGGEWVESVDEVLRYSRTPIRISGGEEPVQIDKLTTERAVFDSLSRERVGTVRTLLEEVTVSTRDWTTLDFNRVVYDDLQSDKISALTLPSGTYEIDLRITASGPVDVRLRVGDDVISRDRIAADDTKTIHAYPRIETQAVVEVQAQTTSTATVTPDRAQTRLAIMHLG